MEQIRKLVSYIYKFFINLLAVFAKKYHPYNLRMQRSVGLAMPLAFFIGPLYPGIIPHARGWSPTGFSDIDQNNTQLLTKVANQTSNGVATFWLMGVFQGLYVINNASRNILIREEIMGVTTENIREYHKYVFGNNMMVNFPIWQSINSEMYKKQRRFLDINFKKEIENLLPIVKDSVLSYVTLLAGREIGLKKFVYGLVLHIGSQLPVINLSTLSLAYIFNTNPKFEQAIYKIAQYGVSQMGDPDLELFFYNQFCVLFRENFKEIQKNDDNILKNIFESRGLSFPKIYEDFERFNKKIKYDIAMNFLSVVIGGMVHTTANSFDWLLANFSKEPNKINLVKQLIEKHKYLNLINRDLFETTFRPIRDLIITNVLINPTFTHELFFCGTSFNAKLPDGVPIYVPQNSFILVNYMACNHAGLIQSAELTRKLLEDNSTEKISCQKQVASFGGSVLSGENKKTRICPGRNFSLYEQMIMLVVLLKYFDISFNTVDCSPDNEHFPIHSRKNKGNICIKQKSIQNSSYTNSIIMNMKDSSLWQKKDPARQEGKPPPCINSVRPATLN